MGNEEQNYPLTAAVVIGCRRVELGKREVCFWSPRIGLVTVPLCEVEEDVWRVNHAELFRLIDGETWGEPRAHFAKRLIQLSIDSAVPWSPDQWDQETLSTELAIERLRVAGTTLGVDEASRKAAIQRALEIIANRAERGQA